MTTANFTWETATPRERDAAVAAALGWTSIRDGYGFQPGSGYHGPWAKIPRYSTDDAVAFTVVWPEIRKLDGWAAISHIKGTKEPYVVIKGKECFSGPSDADNICRALLRLKGRM